MEEEILEILKSNDYRNLPFVISANEIMERFNEFFDYLIRHEGHGFENTEEAYQYWIKNT